MATSTITSNADFVVEQGTSGNWTYRKWNSGIAECWKKFPKMLVNCSTSYGYSYYATAITNQLFPNGLFISQPTLSLTALSGDGLLLGVSELTKDGFGFYPYANSSGNHYLTFDVYVIGKWK